MATDESNNQASPAAAPSKSKGPSILCLGAPRTGTKSLAEALRILGYNKVYHTSEIPIASPDWKFLNEAADATFPSLPNHEARELSREDWDKIFGDYDAVTDIGAFYAKSLLAAYPEAKVILVERDLRSWWTSWRSYLDVWAGPAKLRMTMAVDKVLKTENQRALYKAHLGWVGGDRLWDLHDKARIQYAGHYSIIRLSVPADRLLEYQFSDGWGPLCGFLGKGVPEGKEFPKLNDIDAFREFQKARQKERMRVLVDKVKYRPAQKRAGGTQGDQGDQARQETDTNVVVEKKERPRTSVFIERFESVKKKADEKRVSYIQARKEKREAANAKKENAKEVSGTAEPPAVNGDKDKKEAPGQAVAGGANTESTAEGDKPVGALKASEGKNDTEVAGDAKTDDDAKNKDEEQETFHPAPEPEEPRTEETASSKGKEPVKNESERFPEMA